MLSQWVGQYRVLLWPFLGAIKQGWWVVGLCSSRQSVLVIGLTQFFILSQPKFADDSSQARGIPRKSFRDTLRGEVLEETRQFGHTSCLLWWTRTYWGSPMINFIFSPCFGLIFYTSKLYSIFCASVDTRRFTFLYCWIVGLLYFIVESLVPWFLSHYWVLRVRIRQLPHLNLSAPWSSGFPLSGFDKD